MAAPEQQLVIDGRTSAEDAIGVQSIAIRPELFDTLGLPLIAGRTFTDVEMQNQEANVAILNQELAERLWPGESALDRRIGFRDQRRHPLASRHRRRSKCALRGDR